MCDIALIYSIMYKCETVYAIDRIAMITKDIISNNLSYFKN